MSNIERVRASNSIRVTVNSSAGILKSTNPVTVKNITTLSNSPSTRLDSLVDVNATNEIEGATLVYDAATDKYVVKQLELKDISGDLDGGTF